MSNEEAAARDNKFDLDNILTDDVGQFGKYQALTILLVTLPVISSSVATGEYIFTTARTPTRCLIPQCDSENPTFAPEWVLNAIPGASSSSFDNCVRYRNGSLASHAAGECPAEWFDTTQTEPCGEYVYENTYSIVHEFGLACDEWKRSQIGSIRTIGNLLVLPLTGYVSDRWGRRVALIINAFNTACFGLIRSFVNSYEWFLTIAVLETTIGAGAFSSSYILVTELVGPKYRVLVGTLVSVMFALGQVTLGLLAWAVPEWRCLMRILYAPQLIIVIYYWILPESVRWLMSKGRYAESEAILKKVAKMNKTKLSEKSLQLLRETHAAAETEKSIEKPKEPWLAILVLRSRIILLRCAVSPIWWITNTLVYYGMSINAVNLSGNQYLNFVYVSLVEIPGNWSPTFVLDRFGRKPVIIACYWLCAACQFAFAFMPGEWYGLSLAVYLLGKFFISALMTSVYVYTAELYPTKYRHSLFAFSSMLGRLGSIAAPLTPALALTVWENFPSVLFGSFAVLSGLLMFLTPETLGTKLPDTMEEAEQMGSGKPK